jgi:hypothetical protein
VRPAAPRWAAIYFEPRLALFPEFKAVVLLKAAVDGSPTGRVYVSWRTVSLGEHSVALRVDIADPAMTVPVYTKLPGQPVYVLDSSTPIEFQV